MSRMSGYEDYDYDSNVYYLWPSVTKRALDGKRGQSVLKELETALLALPVPKLIEGEFCNGTEVCALGALAVEREIKAGKSRKEALIEIHKRFEYWDAECDPARFAQEKLDLVYSLTWEVMWRNEDSGRTPEERYEKVLAWVRSRIKVPE